MFSTLYSLFLRIRMVPHPTLTSDCMDQLTPSNEPAEHNECEPLFPYFAGYSFSNTVALNLQRTLAGDPILSAEDIHNLRVCGDRVRHIYPFRSDICDNLRKHLESKGQTFQVFVAFAGKEPFDYIIATQGGDHSKDPPPKATEGKDEAFISEWLEANGNIPTFLSCHVLTLFTGVAPGEYWWSVRFDADINFD